MKALITGASSGMGRDMAKILSQKGYDLILVARDEKKLEEVKKQLKTETKIVVMDISNEENCKKIYEENKDIDILINNTIKSIENGEFNINPKVYKKKNISCEYCNFKDICFVQKDDEVVLEDKDEVDDGTTVSN